MGEGRKKASEHLQRKREAKEADKIEVAPGVTVASLRRFRVASIEPTKDSLSDVDCASRETRSPVSTEL